MLQTRIKPRFFKEKRERKMLMIFPKKHCFRNYATRNATRNHVILGVEICFKTSCKTCCQLSGSAFSTVL